MIDIELYRIRIGTFQPGRKSRQIRVRGMRKPNMQTVGKSLFMKLFIGLCLLITASSLLATVQPCHVGAECGPLISKLLYKAAENLRNDPNFIQYLSLGRNETSNFKARYKNGNIRRGLVNMHVNIRSIYNKMGEVKNLVKQNKQHILGISETELNSHHNVNSLKIPGYDLLMPKSWDSYGRARVIVYVKKTLEYEHLPDLEHADIQSVWLRAGFKNSRKVFYSHQYREHTNTMGNSMAAQRRAQDRMLMQWEAALVYGNTDTTNEVHIAGDMNLDCMSGRWLESSYSLVSLGRMVADCCNSNNFSQVVDQVTRIQYNSIRNETSTSCLDHVYCNARYRISPVKVITFGGSDHDAILYTRYSKEPKPPARTIRKRSYKIMSEI